MSDRHRPKIIVFICTIALGALLAVAIANLPSRSVSVWQYNWAKSYQQVISSLSSPQEFRQVGEKSEGLTVFEKGDRFGYLNQQKQVVIPAVFDRVNHFSGNYALVKFRGKYGIIDRTGKARTGFNYDSDRFVADLPSGYIFATKNNLQGVVDLEGNTLIPPEYESISAAIFQWGYGIVEKKGKMGIIDLNNRVLVPFEYEDIGIEILDRGYAMATKNGKAGVLRIDNRANIPFEFESIEESSIGQGYGVLTKGDRQGVMDFRGNILLPFNYEEVNEIIRLNNPEQGYIIPSDNYQQDMLCIVTKGNSQGVIDAEGKATVPIVYDRVERLDNGRDFFVVTRKNQQGLINFEGETIISLQDGKITSPKYGDYVLINRNSRQGAIDLQGKIAIPAQYDSVVDVDGEYGYAIATKDNLQGAIDLKGKVLLPFEYDSIRQQYYGSEFLLAEKNNLSDLYSLKQGKVVLTGLDNISFPKTDCVFATRNGKQGVADTLGNIKIPFKYDRIVPFSQKLHGVILPTYKNGKHGASDIDNQHLTIPPEYDRIDYLNPLDNYGIVVKDGQTGIYDPRSDRFTPLEYDAVELLFPDEYARVAEEAGKEITIVKNNAALLLKENNQTRLLLNNFYDPKIKYAIATKNGKQGVLDINTAEVVIPIEYDQIDPHSHNRGYTLAIKAGTGILNLQQRSFVPIKADDLYGSLIDRGYVIFFQNGKEGIANLAGKIIVPAEFNILSANELYKSYPDKLQLIDSSHLIATKNGQQGILNLDSQKFLASNYDSIASGGDNIEPGYLIATKNEQSGIIDLQGNVVVPLADRGIKGYRQGVVLRGDNNYDLEPQIVSQSNKSDQSDRDLFINDLAVLTVGNRYSTSSCVVNRRGKVLFEAQHHNWGAGEKIDNLCRSLTGTKVDNSLINENPRVSELGDYNYLIRNGFIAINVNGKWGYSNAKGNVIIYPQFDGAKTFAEDLAAISQNGQWGYINRAGKIVIPPQFDDAESFSGGMAAVMQGNKRDFIDATGKTILNTKYNK